MHVCVCIYTCIISSYHAVLYVPLQFQFKKKEKELGIEQN